VMGPDLHGRAVRLAARLEAKASSLIRKWTGLRPQARHHLSLALVGGAVAMALLALARAAPSLGVLALVGLRRPQALWHLLAAFLGW